MTALRALDGLAAGGLVERRPGAGTFVRGGGVSRAIRAELADVFAHLKAIGRSTAVRLLSFAYVAPPEAVARALGLDPGQRTQRAARPRLVDGAPFSWLVTHVPERVGAAYSEADLATTPLLELLERSDVVAERPSQAIGATLAAPEVAEAPRLDIGAPLPSLTRVVRDKTGKGVEHLRAQYWHDRFSFQMDLLRAGARGERRWKPISSSPSRSGSSIAANADAWPS